ncbi:Endonuclease/exonuclease/phosphatase [Corchorus olitorius]|uniref:Endonuclease/exonuclease/phosphatase n=1 Tax=Corchorus olitorius TaxID=93759 RepID=A0A1R3JVG0_9ROSI|nr:Endonuclease/exonuclease/phosphatase [Corchorus olitorius]
MSSNFRRREPSWTESSESDFSNENSDQTLSRAIANAYRPRAWRGPIFPVHQEELTEGRILWRHCVLAYMFDIRVFSVNYLQSLIRREWRSTGAIQVVGRQGKLYIIFVENEADRDKIVRRGLYAFQGAFFAVDWWHTNSPFRDIVPARVPVWLQIWDLPLEYQVPSIATRMASLAGEHDNMDIGRMLNEQMRQIERRRGFPTFYDTQEVHFTNRIMAFHRRVDRHTTRMTFTRMADDDQVVPEQELQNHYIPVPAEPSDDEDFHISDVPIPDNSEDSDRPQRFRHHDLPLFPNEFPPAPTSSTILTDENHAWWELVTGRRIMSMDASLPSSDRAESSRMAELRAQAQNHLQIPSALSNPMEVQNFSSFAFVSPATNEVSMTVTPDLNVEPLAENTNPFEIGHVSLDNTVNLEIPPAPHYGTLQDIISLHIRPIPPTLDEWIQTREGIDANHSQLLNLGNNAINSTASCGFILDAFTPTTIAEALTIQPETLLASVTTSSIVVASEAPVLSAANEASLVSPIAHSNVLFAESPDHVSVSSQQDVHTAIVPNPTLKRKRSTALLSSDADDEFSSENSESKKLLTTQFNSLEVTQQTTLDILVQDALNTSTSLPAEVPTMGNSSPTTSSLGLRQTVPQQPDVVFLMETKLNVTSSNLLCNRLGFVDSFCVPCSGKSRGDVQLCHLTAIYGHPVLHKRQQVWDQIKHLSHQVGQQEWLLMGDFNQILSQADKLSFKASSTIQGSEALIECLNYCHLLDLPGSGQTFTWTNNRDGQNCIWEKLDRVFVSSSWLIKYDQVKVHNLPVLYSDHGAIVINTNAEPSFTRRPYRFEAMWLQHPGCRQVIQQAWQPDAPGSFQYQLLQQIQGHLQDMDTSMQEKEIRKQLEELMEQEQNFWWQKSRIQWIVKGEKNTKFFHAMTKRRRVRNSISRIKNNMGEIVQDHQNIKQTFHQYFNHLYSKNPQEYFDEATITAHLQQLQLPKLSDRHKQILQSPIIHSEIEEAVFALGPLKSPGPDGKPAIFFQKNWDTISPSGNILLMVLILQPQPIVFKKQSDFSKILYIGIPTGQNSNGCHYGKLNCLIKSSFFLWKIVNDSLPVASELIKRAAMIISQGNLVNRLFCRTYTTSTHRYGFLLLIREILVGLAQLEAYTAILWSPNKKFHSALQTSRVPWPMQQVLADILFYKRSIKVQIWKYPHPLQKSLHQLARQVSMRITRMTWP